MKKLACVIFIWMSCPFSATAQLNLYGYIRDADSLPVINASVLLHDISTRDKPLVNFAISDNKGFYSLKVTPEQTSYSITVKAPSFQTVETVLEIPDSAATIQQDFILNATVSFLDTVKVDIQISISKTGDTITFNPDAFALKNEVTVEDLLRRLPGVEIKEGGRVFFNGKMVNSVLIDGDDLFKKDYGLLTRNAASKIVDQVQIIKNYQKDQLMKEFNMAGNQVMNLKIKDQYKNYVFGHGALGYGNERNKIADLFLIKLSPQTKTQAGGNYNTTGSTYASKDRAGTSGFTQNDNLFSSYEPAHDLIDIYRYHFYSIPSHYQERNESVQGYTNVLLKRNNWENVLNAKYSHDKLQDNQQLRKTYNDGTILFTDNKGALKNQFQEYNYAASKITKSNSIYINSSLLNRNRDYGSQTASNRSLDSRQQLIGDDLSWQFNFAYNKKLPQGLLWSSSFGYFNQANGENLDTDPDILFWLFPAAPSLVLLKSKIRLQLEYLNIKSSLLWNTNRINHEVGVAVRAENRTFKSDVQSIDLDDHGTQIPFQNNSNLTNRYFTIQYKGRLMLLKKTGLTFKVSTEPHFLNYRLASVGQKATTFFYDYSVGMSSQKRTLNLGAHVGMKKTSNNFDLFFPGFVQTSFHRLQSGRTDTVGVKSKYLQANLNIVSVQMGWLAFFLMNVSLENNDFIRNLETKGIGTIHSFSYHPNSTNQLMLLFTSQKTLGAWPFSLVTELLYNRQSGFNQFNGVVDKSDMQFLNYKIGLKSQFKSIINFDYQFSALYTKNIIKRPNYSTSDATTVLNKINLYLTPQTLFNATVTFNSMLSNKGSFDGQFLDLTMNRKFLNKQLLLELSCRNLFNKRFLMNSTIFPLFHQENKVEIRGTTLFVTARYEIR